LISIRRSSERGHFDHGWLDTSHTFSFGDYYDPAHEGFRTLRVINEDRVAPGSGFPPHGHRDMEILTYVLGGAVEHRDSLGSRATVHAGEIQRMTAGRGVTHSEMNPSPTEELHLLQIWILPERRGLDPSYEQRPMPRDERRGRLHLIAARDGHADSILIHQDALLYSSLLAPGEEVAHRMATGRHAWLQIARGSVAVNGHADLAAGDGLAASAEDSLTIRARSDAELLLFDLA
jgi:redox-sensitive bicupin YhaK (pirin superfamily)